MRNEGSTYGMQAGSGRRRGERPAAGAAEGAAEGATELGHPGWLVPAMGVLGAGLGWGVTFLARWLVTLPLAPLQKPAELVNAIPEPWRSVALLALGLAAGVILGFMALHEDLTVRVADGAVTLTSFGEPREYARDRVALAFRDRKELVLLDPEGGELARDTCDVKPARLADAFTRHGYSWAEQDPHGDEFRRWVPEMAGLPEGANALLTARAQALKQSGGGQDRRELRDELARIGVYVRDEDKRQFVRTR